MTPAPELPCARLRPSLRQTRGEPRLGKVRPEFSDPGVVSVLVSPGDCLALSWARHGLCNSLSWLLDALDRI